MFRLNNPIARVATLFLSPKGWQLLIGWIVAPSLHTREGLHNWNLQLMLYCEQ